MEAEAPHTLSGKRLLQAGWGATRTNPHLGTLQGRDKEGGDKGRSCSCASRAHTTSPLLRGRPGAAVTQLSLAWGRALNVRLYRVTGVLDI